MEWGYLLNINWMLRLGCVHAINITFYCSGTYLNVHYNFLKLQDYGRLVEVLPKALYTSKCYVHWHLQ